MLKKKKQKIKKKEKVSTKEIEKKSAKEPVIEVVKKEETEPRFAKKELEKKPKKSASIKQSTDSTTEEIETEEIETEEIETEEIETEEIEKVNGARKNDEEIERELSQIYGNDDGTMPDMKHFEKKKRSRVITAFFVLIFSCLILGAVAWAGFFIFQPQSRFNEEDVILSIVGDEENVAGQETHYRIRYRNAQNVPLAKVVLQVRYPEGFVFEKSDPEPTNDTNDEWELGSLEEQASGYIDVWGKMYGDLEKKQSFRGFLNYIPANFSAEFQKVATLSTQVTGSPVTMLVVGPDKVSMGAETEFVITLENKNSSSTENLALVIEPGEYFNIKDSEPRADEDNQYQWSIDEIEEGQEIKIVGSFNDIISEDKGTVSFKLLSWKDAERIEEGHVIQKMTHTTEISKTELSANLIINGTVSDFYVQPGEMLHSSIIIKNDGSSVIKDVSVRLVLDTPSSDNKSLLKWIDLEDEADGRIVGEQLSAKIRRGIIEWSSGNVSRLTSIASGEEVIIDFSLPVKTAEDVELIEFTNFEITATVDLKYDKEDEEKSLSSNQIKIFVNSDVAIGVQDEINTVDKKDQHTVTWIVNNTFHELKNIKVEADVYGDVDVPEEEIVVPAGSANYDKENQKLVWTVGSMPTSLDVLALRFNVILNKENPTQTNLTSKVKFTATDVVTGEIIALVGDEVLFYDQSLEVNGD